MIDGIYLNKSYEILKKYDCDSVLQGYYFIVNKAQVGNTRFVAVEGNISYEILTSHCYFFSNNILSKQHYVAGKLLCSDSKTVIKDYDTNVYHLFIESLNLALLKISENLMSHITFYLKNRLIASGPLIENEHIKMILSDIISMLAMVKLKKIKDALTYDELLKSIKKMSCLMGGRSFLSNQLLEIFHLFSIFKNVYL